MIAYHNNQQLNELIDATAHSINRKQLELLIKYVNTQYQRAVAHLGNLVLEGVVKINDITEFKLIPGYHPYWLWFI
jgi:hypothetical protein